jgi:hypothetical protein
MTTIPPAARGMEEKEQVWKEFLVEIKRTCPTI